MFRWIRAVLHLLNSYMYWKKRQIVMVSTTHKHRNLSWLTLYVETPRGAFTHHPSPTLKISFAAVNRGPGWPTDASYLLLCTVFITAIPLSACTCSLTKERLNARWLECYGNSPLPSRRIEDSRLHNAQWKNYKVGTMSRRHYSRKKRNWVELVYSVGCSSFIPWIRVH